MGIPVSKVNVNLNASIQPDGSVLCDLECDGQQAKITFTGTDVLFDIPEPATPSAVTIDQVAAVPRIGPRA